MGTIYRNGEMYGSNTSIDDTKTSDKSTWSSEKISNEVDDRIIKSNLVHKSTNFTVQTGTTIIKAIVKKVNNIVWVEGIFQKQLVLNQWNPLVKLPSGYYLNENVPIIAMNLTRSKALEGKVENGLFSVYPTSDTAFAETTNVALNFSIILD